jgi:hypothetical protein
MGRTPEELSRLRSEAVALRRAGRTRRQIKEALGLIGNSTLNELLRDEPLPESARRALGRDYEKSRRLAAEGVRRYWNGERQAREASRTAISSAAAAEIGQVSDREIRIAGAIAYWCEGAKSKPYRRDEQVRFINSDPALIRLFLKFLYNAGVRQDRLRYRVHIHESADVGAATRYWENLVAAEAGQFTKPNIKRHRPRTVRYKSGTYYGSLQISVLKSGDLYRKISGWAHRAMGSEQPHML